MFLAESLYICAPSNLKNTCVSNLVEHKGIIIAIEDRRIDVSIVAESACGSCKVKNVCGMSEAEEKVVSVGVEHTQYFEVGEQVDVLISQGMGMKAVTAAYIVPFFILLGSLIILLETGAGEVVAGLTSLGLVMVYYLLLYLNRRRIEKEIILKIRKI